MTSGQLQTLAEPAQVPPEDLLAPSYQNRLRVVGRTLDEHRLDRAVILDIGEDLVLRAYAPERDEYIVEHFAGADLTKAMRDAIYARGGAGTEGFNSPLKPTGYEDFLRALGHSLDRRHATAVTIVECPNYFHVSGQERIGDASNAPVAPFAEQYEVPRISNLLNDAKARRAGVRQLPQPIVRYGDPDVPLRILHTGARLP